MDRRPVPGMRQEAPLVQLRLLTSWPAIPGTTGDAITEGN